MMVWLALFASLVAFIGVLKGLAAQQHAVNAVRLAQGALAVISDPELDDDTKEHQVQRASISLLKSFVILLGIGIAACVSAYVLVAGGNLIGLYSMDDVWQVATSAVFLVVSTIAAVLLWIVLSRRRSDGGAEQASEARDEVPYSPMDKALHLYAFSSSSAQGTLASMENHLWRKRIQSTPNQCPVFVTSLPRAGTTILLELLARQSEFASPTYRHMPFTMAPLLWGRYSRLLRKSGTRAERAHGDGIEVDFESPEAFEEMVWMAYWKEKYGSQHIETWQADDRNAEFEEFFDQHLRKVIIGKPGSTCYVSKNNANIARLPLLKAMYPESRILIPVREPLAQVQSLMRQHQRFSDLHERDRFARQYMEGIGHFEFGGALKPIAFAGAPEDTEGSEQVDYWLRYWIAAYEHVLSQAPRDAVFVDHEALSQTPALQLPRIAEALVVNDQAAMVTCSDMFRASREVRTLPDASPELLRRAREVHAELLERTLKA
ncbi:sulfotransferase [Halomonas huangheensis]|uniref:Sulfotransferase domain-containing protein n=1 Tax=Halomonas huangheensis TaxID=1178482 RepID=W1NBQ6_9GAMM|nr:sulfotransferase [Halomonas huangheensis]ALM52523.1 hypothetical protein AR456_09730 [Halomonas huangheensis]ERL52974.1 hypothetical protein BJB45_16975 [Halomonas huangheensis]